MTVTTSATGTQPAESNQTKGRFAVGQKIVIMRYLLEGARTFLTPVPYTPWVNGWGVETKMIGAGVLFKVLTVKQMIDVPGDWDDVVQYKGYLLEDEDGNVWANQYPRASYSQLSDAPDYHFRRHFPDDIDFKSLTDDQIATWEAAAIRIGEIRQGVRDLQEIDYEKEKLRSGHVLLPKEELENRTQLFQTHLDWVIKKMKVKTGAVTEFKELITGDPRFLKAVVTLP